MNVLGTGRKRTNRAAILACLFAAAPTLLSAQTSNEADREARPPAHGSVKSPASRPPFVPMTESQRLKFYFKSTFAPMSFFTSAVSAGIGQWRDRPTAWHQGAEGYGRRYASSYGEHIVLETLVFGGSSLLHEDNRFIPSGQAGAGNRVRYAVESTFLARHDDGTRHLSISRLAGLAGAALISRAWQPRNNRRLNSAALNFGISLSMSTGFSVAREFLPFIFSRK
jgi:hypothetical protein